MTEVEVERETANSIWIMSGGSCPSPRRQAIKSNDSLFYRTRELAVNEARAILKNRIANFKDELRRHESALEHMK